MVIRTQRGLSTAQRTELWERWRQGETISEIGRALGARHTSIVYIVHRRGGFSPPERHRAKYGLSLAEREEISRGLIRGDSYRCIGCQLGRAGSTISREVQRNGGRDAYRAVQAEQAMWDRAKRPKACKLAMQPRLRGIVAEKLKLAWSPQQIAGWLKRQYPQDESLQVSHETIYRSLYLQGRGLLKRELLKYLRSGRKVRHGLPASSKGSIVDPVKISERPAEVKDRAVPGHWEGDLIVGSRHSYIATLVERQTRYVMLAKLKNKRTETVLIALAAQIQQLPVELRKSLTWDRGAELANHKAFTVSTDVQVYFCDPYSPWQRGSNENTNGLLRQYFPKGTDLSVHSQVELDRVARQLNERPRETLDFESPAERFEQCVAAIG